MDKQLFFAVWGLPELRNLIKSFMYPGEKTSNYYDYRNASSAAYYGYLSLFVERGNKLQYYDSAMNYAAHNGHLNIIKWLHHNRTEGCTSNAMGWAAGNGHLDVIQWLHHNRTEGCTVNIIHHTAVNGHLDVMKWLHHNRTEGCTSNAIN